VRRQYSSKEAIDRSIPMIKLPSKDHKLLKMVMLL
jgi:hypothetical protein